MTNVKVKLTESESLQKRHKCQNKLWFWRMYYNNFSFYLRSVLSANETAGFLSAVEAAIPFLEKSYSLKVTSKRNTPLCCILQNQNIIQTIYQIINLHTLFPCLIVLQMWWKFHIPAAKTHCVEPICTDLLPLHILQNILK